MPVRTLENFAELENYIGKLADNAGVDKILVIGGSGFLGSHVSDCLSQNGFKVTIYDIKKSKWLRKDQKMIIGNISNDKRLEQAIKGNSFVYNFAAISDIDFASERPRETVEVNILGTARI